MSKHIVNNKEDWASEALKGYLQFNNSNLLALKEFPNVIIRKDYMSLEESNSRVALLSGGGSGHEPAHLGFIGHGMLTGVVCGNLFASPSTSAILAAIRFVGRSNKAGVLLIVKNYTGDRLNFGLAAKRAQLEGINVDWVLVDDDVALINNENRKDDSVGERGLAGTVFIHKIAGALAEQRKSLSEIKAAIENITKNSLLRTLGFSLSGRVQLPGETENKGYKLEPNQIEIGLGIHGEAGRRKIEILKSHDLVKLVFDEYLLSENLNKSSNPSDVCLMVNNLGGLSNLELYLLVNDCFAYLAKNRPDLKLRRVYCDTLMTSLNMNGASLTLLFVENESILGLLDSKTQAPSWPKSFGSELKEFEYTAFESAGVQQTVNNDKYIKIDEEASKTLELYLNTVCNDLILFTDYLNELDSGCGDGDCGSSLAKVCEAILKEANNKKFNFEYPHQVFINLSNILENGGGSLSIILSLFASAAAQAFSKEAIDDKSSNIELIYWVKIWNNALVKGLNAVQEYGKAKPGQRSIVDPLHAAKLYLNDYVSSYEKNKLDLEAILKNLVDATYKAVEQTAKMQPRVGRASYVNSSLINMPDAGATAMNCVFASVYKAYLMHSKRNQ